MRKHIWIGGLVIFGLVVSASTAAAQAVVQSDITVPIISVFTVGTTVSVPDRGGTSLGGFRSASTTRTEFGPGFGRGLASRNRTSDASVHVWIHDFQELEDSLAKSSDHDSGPPPTGFVARMHQYAAARPEKRNEVAKEEPPAAKPSRDDLFTSKIDHAADLLKRGQDAESRGKLSVAKLYFKSVVSLGSTPSARTAQDHLNTLETKIAGR